MIMHDAVSAELETWFDTLIFFRPDWGSRANLSGQGMKTFERVKEIVGETLRLGDRAAELQPDSALLGAIPEFDSLAVVEVIKAIEDQIGISINDDDISGETFETIGSLAVFVDDKIREAATIHQTSA